MTPTRRSTPLASSNASTQPTAEDVRAFIAARQAPAASTTPQEMPMTPQVAKFIEESAKGDDADLPIPEIPKDAAAQPDITNEAGLRESALKVEGEASLTADDKDAYVRATLFDTPLVLHIPLLRGKGSAAVRTLSIAHEDLLTWWLSSLEKDGTITTQGRWLVMMQRAHVLLRVVSLQAEEGAPTTPYTCEEVERLVQEITKYKMETAEDGTIKEAVKGIGVAVPVELHRRAIDALNRHVSNTFRSMQPARYALLQMAVAEHEKKFNALTRLAASGNF